MYLKLKQIWQLFGLFAKFSPWGLYMYFCEILCAICSNFKYIPNRNSLPILINLTDFENLATFLQWKKMSVIWQFFVKLQHF